MANSPVELARDRIELSGRVDGCLIGVFPSERQKPQALDVSISLLLDVRPASSGRGLSGTVDYAKLAGEIRFLLQRCRFPLIESAAEAIARYALSPPAPALTRAPIRAARVRIAKPDALDRRLIPSVQVERSPDDLLGRVEQTPFGEVDVIHEEKGYGIYRLRVAPGGKIANHEHRIMEEDELVLGEGLLLQGRPVRSGTAFSWPKGLAHRYENPTSTEQSVLCIDRPAYLPSDELEVPVDGSGGGRWVEGVSYYPSEQPGADF